MVISRVVMLHVCMINTWMPGPPTWMVVPRLPRGFNLTGCMDGSLHDTTPRIFLGLLHGWHSPCCTPRAFRLHAGMVVSPLFNVHASRPNIRMAFSVAPIIYGLGGSPQCQAIIRNFCAVRIDFRGQYSKAGIRLVFSWVEA